MANLPRGKFPTLTKHEEKSLGPILNVGVSGLQASGHLPHTEAKTTQVPLKPQQYVGEEELYVLQHPMSNNATAYEDPPCVGVELQPCQPKVV